MEILPDVPVECMIAIHAEVRKVAQKHNLPFGKAFYVVIERYKQALSSAELERISVEEAIYRLDVSGYSENLSN